MGRLGLSAKQCIKAGNFKESYNNWLKASARWKKHWFDTCVTIFKKFKKFAKEFIIDEAASTITKIEKIIYENPNIEWRCEKIDYPEHTELFYLVEGVDKNDKVIFSKVGTTTRTIDKRMSEELVYYRSLGVDKMIVNRVYDCGDVVAECYESWFRAKYILKYPHTFKKNDRFFGVTFDFEEADTWVEELREM